MNIVARKWIFGLVLLFMGQPQIATAQAIDLTNPLRLTTFHAAVESVVFKDVSALRVTSAPETVTANPAGDAERNRVDHLVLVGNDFHNGTIELDIAGEPGHGASGGARGFVGIAFRVQPDHRQYDCIYLRPTNGRGVDQERRNHSVQYVSHPTFPWYRLRKDSPGRYESYVDLQPATWTHVRIVVEDDRARLYVHRNDQPSLVVNDIKSGTDGHGGVALWIEGSTIAHFANLSITR